MGQGQGAVVPHAAASLAELPEMVLWVRVRVPSRFPRRRRADGGIAGDGAVGQGEGAVVVPHAAAEPPAELPEMVLWVRVQGRRQLSSPSAAAAQVERNCRRWCCRVRVQGAA